MTARLLFALTRVDERNGPSRMTSPDPAARRVLLLLTDAYGRDGGIQAYNRLLIGAFRTLAETDGLDVTVLLLNDRNSDAVPCAVTSHFSLRTFAGCRRRFAGAALAHLISRQPDLVIVGHVNFTPLAVVLRAVRPPAKQWFLAYGWEVWTRLGIVHRWGLRHASLILAISRFTRRLMAQHNDLEEERIALLPCALDPAWDVRHAALAPQPPDRGHPVLLTVSRLDAGADHKGIDQVLRALPIIAREVPGVRFVVVGHGADRPRLERLARDTGVESRVEFRGRLSRDLLAQAYSACSLFIMPSEKEGFGIVFIEAALFGKPSIAARCGGSPEVVEDGVTGRLVDPHDVGQIARAAIELLSDPDELRALGERARSRVAALFTYEAFRQRLAGYVLGREHLAFGGRPSDRRSET